MSEAIITDYARKQAAESREACKHPGKFEGCNPWTAYFWWQTLDGCADYDDATGCVRVEIIAQDRALFPELPKRRRVIRMCETDSGSVVEC